MRYYAITKDGMLSEHRLLYTEENAAWTELETMQQAHGTAWPARLKGAMVAEVHVGFIDQDSQNVQTMLAALQQIAAKDDRWLVIPAGGTDFMQIPIMDIQRINNRQGVRYIYQPDIEEGERVDPAQWAKRQIMTTEQVLGLSDELPDIDGDRYNEFVQPLGNIIALGTTFLSDFNEGLLEQEGFPDRMKRILMQAARLSDYLKRVRGY